MIRKIMLNISIFSMVVVAVAFPFVMQRLPDGGMVWDDPNYTQPATATPTSTPLPLWTPTAMPNVDSVDAYPQPIIAYPYPVVATDVVAYAEPIEDPCAAMRGVWVLPWVCELPTPAPSPIP